ncbi:hypothetical protein [Silvibacterium sp.]|uniref:aldose epimerase family protein n=1 Tax=Silvibacterium sp. TaxID=1964179 RepID=UPI0039E5ED19
MGTTRDGHPVDLFTLIDHALTVTITNYGAHVVSIETPDRSGKRADVVLGYKHLVDHENDNDTYLGSLVGRYGTESVGDLAPSGSLFWPY